MGSKGVKSVMSGSLNVTFFIEIPKFYGKNIKSPKN